MAKRLDKISVSHESLRKTVSAILEKMGETATDAAEAANVLVDADLRGVEIEGVALLPAQISAYRQGTVKPNAKWRVIRETPGTATVDGDRGLVWILGSKLMSLAIAKARKVGVGAIAMHNGGDAGRLGHYAMMAAEQNMVGLVTNCGGLRAVPTHGGEPRLGTNPIAIAAPSKAEVPIVFDAATTASAFGWLRIAHRDGVPFPPGTIAELDGTPVMVEAPSRPAGQYHLLPLGGDKPHGSQKGYGFSLMAEILATMLSGALPTLLDAQAGSRGFFAAFDISAFVDVDVFKENMDRVLRALRQTRPAPGHDSVSYPGLRGYEEAQRRRITGIPLHPDTIEWFSDTCRELSVPRVEVVA